MVELNNILHVEDDLDIQEVTKLALEDFGGFSVMQCSSGQAALSKAPELKPDLLILDVMMPDMTGIETLKELRKLAGYETIPAIFMTAKARPEEVENYFQHGAIAVITKPFDVMTLADKVRGHWEKAIKGVEPNVIPFPAEPRKDQDRKNDAPRIVGR